MKKIVLLYPLLYVLTLCINLQELKANQSDSLLFVIRIDDILSRNMSILPRSILPLEDTLASRGAKATWGLMPHRLLEAANADGQLASEIKQSHRNGH